MNINKIKNCDERQKETKLKIYIVCMYICIHTQYYLVFSVSALVFDTGASAFARGR